jgi:hypothetical protein
MVGLCQPPPPLSTWVIGQPSDEEPELDPAPASVTVEPFGPTDRTPVILEPPSPPRHAWADVAALTLEVSGSSNRLFYVLATGRTAEALVAWRQGPFLLGDETSLLHVDVPEPFAAAVRAEGRAWLDITIASTTADDREFPREPLGSLPLVLDGGRVVGVPSDRWEAIFPDSLEPLAEVQP